MSWRGLKAVAARLARADSAAAEMAFFLAISLVPFVAVSVALVRRWLPMDLSASFADVLHGVLPAESRVEAGEVLQSAQSSTSQGWLTVGFLVALWTSFRFMSRCVRSLTLVIAGESSEPERFWHSTFRSVALLVVWTAVLVATALFLVATPEIEHGLLRLPVLSELSLSMFAATRAALVAVVLFSAIGLTYRVAAGARASRLRVALAALVATGGWIGASFGFSRAIAVLWGSTPLYGTLGSVVLFLFWAYAIAWILLLGGHLLVPFDGGRSAATGVAKEEKR